MDEEGPGFWCNCPYDYEGICKHSVALGLAVLEKLAADAAPKKPGKAGQKKNGAASNVVPDEPAGSLAEIVSASELEAALRDVPKPEQLKFLALQLRQNAKLARAFLTQFIGPPLPPDPLDADPTRPRLEELRDELRRALGRLRFDYNSLADDDGTAPRIMYKVGMKGRFMAELEQQIALVLEPVLLPAAGAIRAAVAAGRLAEALRRWHGAWLGISSVKKPAADAYNLFYGNYYPRQVAETWLALLGTSGIKGQLGQQEFAPAEVSRCRPVLVRAVAEPLRPGAATFPPVIFAPPLVLPDIDMELLLTVAVNPTVAPALREALQPYPHRLLLPLQLRLAQGCRDWPAWEPLAAQLAATDAQILQELLQFYLDQSRMQELVALAEAHFTKNTLLLTDFVLAHLTAAHNRPLYVKALTQRLEKHHDFADFETLTELWTEKERAKFVLRVLVQLPNRFPALLRARVLAAENRPADILPLVLTFSWHSKARTSYWTTPPPSLDLSTLPELLQLTARFQPEATLDAVMERVESYLEQTSLRSVELYANLAQWLKALWELPVLTEQVALFAEGLYGKYNKLAYLRRALREAALLPELEPAPPKLPRPGTTPRPGRKPKNPFGR